MTAARCRPSRSAGYAPPQHRVQEDPVGDRVDARGGVTVLGPVADAGTTDVQVERDATRRPGAGQRRSAAPRQAVREVQVVRGRERGRRSRCGPGRGRPEP